MSVCRDHANGICQRQQCKYYHIPVAIPPANVMATTAAMPRFTSAAAPQSGTANVVELTSAEFTSMGSLTLPNHNNNTNNNYNNHGNVITTGCLTSITPTTTTTTLNTTIYHHTVGTTPSSNFSDTCQQISTVIPNTSSDNHHSTNQQLSSTNTTTTNLFPSVSSSLTSSSLDAAQLSLWHVLRHNL